MAGEASHVQIAPDSSGKLVGTIQAQVDVQNADGTHSTQVVQLQAVVLVDQNGIVLDLGVLGRLHEIAESLERAVEALNEIAEMDNKKVARRTASRREIELGKNTLTKRVKGEGE